MSLAQTQDTLTHDPAVLQQHAASGDLFAMAKLYKLMQAQKAQQMQAGLAQQMQPPVKAQLLAAAAQNVAPEQQPEQSGIAMAAGGIVRHFYGGGGADTHSGLYNDIAPAWEAIKSAFRPQSDEPPSDTDKEIAQLREKVQTPGEYGLSAGQQAQDYALSPTKDAAENKTSGAAQRAIDRARLEALIAAKGATGPKGIAAVVPDALGNEARHSLESPAAAKPTVASKSGIAGAAPQSGPTGYHGFASPNADGTTPESTEETYRDRADALTAKLDPLYAKQRDAFKTQTDAENTAYSGLQDAKKLSKWDQLTRLGDKLSQAADNADGSPAINHGIADLGRFGARNVDERQKLKIDAANAEAKHQITLNGINAGATDAEIKQALAQYNLVNGAVAADDKSEINWYRAEAKKAADDKRAAAAQVTAAAKAAKGAGGPKSMNETQIQSAAVSAAAHTIAAAQKAQASDPSVVVPDFEKMRSAAEARIRAKNAAGVKDTVQSTPPIGTTSSKDWGIKPIP